jgi:hypothetical protein
MYGECIDWVWEYGNVLMFFRPASCITYTKLKLKLKRRGVNSGLFLFSSARLKCVWIDTIVLVEFTSLTLLLRPDASRYLIVTIARTLAGLLLMCYNISKSNYPRFD